MTDRMGIIVASRTMSKRLPRKALLPLQSDLPMILFLLERLKPSKGVQIVFATTELETDDDLADVVRKSGTPVFRGSADDLIARYVAAADRFGFEVVGRVTGDCPFVNAELVNYCVGKLGGLDGFDLVSTKGAFPVGLDIELYRASTMKRVFDTAPLTDADREHLTLYLYNHANQFSLHTLPCPPEWQCAGRTFTVDTFSDLEEAREIASKFKSPVFPLSALAREVAP